MGSIYEKPFWQSKKWWAMIATLILALIKSTGVEVPTEAFLGTSAYMVGQGIADGR